MWLSLNCTKLSSPFIFFFASPSATELRTPPCITYRAPVPAQAMHFRKPRRSTPSWLWSYTSSFCVFPERACWDVVFTVLLSSGHTKPQCSFSSPLPANFHGGRRG